MQELWRKRGGGRIFEGGVLAGHYGTCLLNTYDNQNGRCTVASISRPVGRGGSRGFKRTPLLKAPKDFIQCLLSILPFVSGSLASLPLRISTVQTCFIVASTAFVHGEPAGTRAYKAVTPLR